MGGEGGGDNAIYEGKSHHANFRCNPVYQATERHLTVKLCQKMKWGVKTLFSFWAELCSFRVLNLKVILASGS